MDPKKVQAIWNWSIPRNIFEVRSLHGLTSFYRKFIKGFIQIYATILETIKDINQPFKWTEEANRNFKLLKKRTREELILALPDFEKVFQLEIDASEVAVGIVLSQEQRPIAYFTQKLNETKKNYSSHDKEFYVILQALNKWRHYLLPKEFILYSDNHAL